MTLLVVYLALSVMGILMECGLSLSAPMEVCLPVAVTITLFACGIVIQVIASGFYKTIPIE